MPPFRSTLAPMTVVALVLALAACAPAPGGGPAAAGTAAAGTAAAPGTPGAEAMATLQPALTPLAADASPPVIEGLALPSSYVEDGQIQLREGKAEEPAAAGASGTVLVQLAQQAAIGDFDGDERQDMAFVLIASPGGSGTFYDLYVVLNEAAGARPLTPVTLGDRVKLQSLLFADGGVVASFLDHAPGQAMAEEPGTPVRRRFQVQEGRLVEQAVPGMPGPGAAAPGLPTAGTPGAAGSPTTPTP